MASAQAEMDRVAGNFRRDYPVDKMADLQVKVVSMLDLVVKHVRPALLTIMAVVGLVLIIACANVANLSLARGSERQKEIAIRTALGATRTRVVRQVLTESLVLSFLGMVVGLFMAFAGLRLLWFLRPPNLPRLENIQMDGTALAFAIGATVFSALLFGLLPALAASPDAMKEGGRGTVGPGRRSVRSILIVSEIAVSMVVLVTAGLLLRSFAALERVETGFTKAHVFTFQVALPFSRYNPATAARFYKDLQDELRALPGVEAAGAINLLPLGSTSNPFGWASEAAPDQWAAQAADTRIVTPEYFSAMGVKLLAGRVFTGQDDLSRPYEVVVDDVLARRAWPGVNPIGQKVNMTTFHLNSPPTKEWWQVIGVVQHVHNESLTEEGMLQIYRPLLQDPNLNMTMIVRSAGDQAGLQRAAEAVLHKMDKDVPMHKAQTMSGYIKIAQAPMAFNLILIGAFALIALILASVGLYGVIAYLVSQRTREIGVRIALGAQRSQILRLILSYGLKLTVAGLAAGVLLSLAASRVISNQLFEVKSTDLTTYILTPLVLAIVAMLASYLPSRRAASLDPMKALRHDGQ
jgi:putative ABC transport system permease protein